MESMLRIASDVSDLHSQKAAIVFLGRSVSIWGQPPGTSGGAPNGAEVSEGLPGFERFIYERIVSAAFAIPSAPDLNVKDGQVLMVSYLRITERTKMNGLPDSSRNCESLADYL
jgi:exportin-T